MARAKRTVRTEARRRTRAVQAGDIAGAGEGDEPTQSTDTRSTDSRSPAAGRRRPAQAASAPAARPPRPSVMASVRAAYRPPNVREDLKVLPRLLIHWSVLVAAVLAVVSTAAIIAIGTSTTSTSTASSLGVIVSMVFSLFVGSPSPPPFGAALLIGFMVPRATWLVGLVYGVLASACFTAVLLVQPADALNGQAITPIIVQAWIIGLVGTMFFSSGIAWYRRFLDLLNPNRGQRVRQQPQKAAQGRGNAPRNRLSGSGR